MNRRDFLKLLGFGGVGAGAGYALKESTKTKVANLIPYLVPPEDIIPGVATWYASLCTQCSAGCGIIVKVMEGRVKKIEGNPLHPVNRGKLCARGQAAVQTLYNPDRIKGPLKRDGERGEGRYIEISWNEGIKLLSENLEKLAQNEETDKAYLLTSSIRGHLNSLLGSFMKVYGSSNYIQYELFQNRNLVFANDITLGSKALPHYDLENTNLLLSFGADFSTTWISPVNYSHAYGKMRQGHKRRRGRLIQIEPRMSLTGANADEWIAIKPGSEGLLAMAIAHTIVFEGYYKGSDIEDWKGILRNYEPDTIGKSVEIDARRIRRLSREVATAKPSLVIGGENVSSYENGLSSLVAINLLNYLTGSIGSKGGIIPNSEDTLKGEPSSKGIKEFSEALSEGKVKALMIYNTNPLFTTPLKMKLQKAFEDIPFIASFSSFMDESTAMADIILPAHTALEDWGDDHAEPAVGYPVTTLMQPAVSSFYNTRGVGDIFLSLSGAMGGRMSKELPWANFRDFLIDSWKGIYGKNRGKNIKEGSFEDFWEKSLARGGWWKVEEPRIPSITISLDKIKSKIPSSPALFDGDKDKFPLYLITYPHPAFFDGRGANLPWLQEMPDPMTSVVWGSWIEINPDTAAAMGIKEGDMVSIESPHGSIIAPAYPYPGIRPDTVAIPIGQGHTQYGRYARNRGANPIEILPAKMDSVAGVLPLNSTRVKISRLYGRKQLVKMEGSTKELGRNIVQTISPAEYEKINKEL